MALKIILGVIIALIAITAVRAVFFIPKKSELNKQPLEHEDVDVKRAAENVSKAITFKTIARTNPEDTEWEEFRKFHEFLETAYPLIHKTMTKEVVSGASLIYHWKGKNPNLKPMGLLSHQDVVPVTPGTEDDWTHRLQRIQRRRIHLGTWNA